MAKKKKKSSKSAGKGKGSSRARKKDLPPIDFRAIEGLMQQFLSGITGVGEDSDQSQNLVFQAFEAETEEERVALAKQALEINPDNADAYVLLAENADSLDEALRLNQEGVAAGERALGPKFFKKNTGHFWGMFETRPYMRARLGLAQCLWSAGRREEAVTHYQEMLRLNPGDNQGVRYILAQCLLDLDRREDLHRLLDQFDEDASAVWGYTRALLAFREEGDTDHSRQLLLDASELNEHVPDYLVGNTPLPRELPELIGIGDEDEAISYVANNLSAWRNTPGAITWLRKALKVALPEPPAAPPLSWDRMKQKLLQLEQIDDEVWQVDGRALRGVPIDDDQEMDTWGVFVVNRTEGTILVFDLGEGRPTPSVVWDYLVEAMLETKHGPSHRPAMIEVRLKSYQKAWQAKLEQIGIECHISKQLDQIDEMIDQASSQFGRHQEASETASTSPEDLPEPSELSQQVGEVWQADIRHLATWVEDDGQLVRPWSVLVVNRDDEKVLAQDLTLNEPSDERFAELVLRAMRQPLIGEPHRPGILEVSSDRLRGALEPRLEPLGVNCVVRDELDQLETIHKELSRHFSGPNQMTAVVDVPGIDLTHVGSFFATAAEFYRRAPWRLVPGDVPIEVRCDSFSSGPWYGMVMGQTGMTLGLALYEDRQVLIDLLSGTGTDEENFRRTSAISVTFNEAFDVPLGDLEAAEKYGWPVAGPEAYPCPMRVNPGSSVRPPLAWELKLLEATLRAIPNFLAGKQKQAKITVPAAGDQVTMEFKMLEDEQF